jgi:NTP pyrophosphatase (non-canonical NTP hydrolase)
MSWAGTELEVIRWSEARGIIANSDSKTQLLKAVSEMGELADAIIKRDRPAIVDGIGDILVCLINLGAIEDIDMTRCLKAAFNEIKDRNGYLNKDGVFIKDELRPC